MTIKTLKNLGLALIMGIIFCAPGSASERLPIGGGTKIISEGLSLLGEVLDLGKVSVKQKQPYDKANDPAHRASPEFSEPPSPQHGYFAVPLVVIGLAGILLYLTRVE